MGVFSDFRSTVIRTHDDTYPARASVLSHTATAPSGRDQGRLEVRSVASLSCSLNPSFGISLPSIAFCLFEMGSWCQQVKQGIPDIPLSVQFPAQTGYIIPSVNFGSTVGSSSSRMRLEDLQRSDQMTEPPLPALST